MTKSGEYDLNLLNSQINKLINLEDETLIETELKNIVPEFHHSLNKD